MSDEDDTDCILWLVLDAISCGTWLIYRYHQREDHGSNILTALTYSSQSNSKLYVQKNNYVPNSPVELVQWKAMVQSYVHRRDLKTNDTYCVITDKININKFITNGARIACPGQVKNKPTSPPLFHHWSVSPLTLLTTTSNSTGYKIHWCIGVISLVKCKVMSQTSAIRMLYWQITWPGKSVVLSLLHKQTI